MTLSALAWRSTAAGSLVLALAGCSWRMETPAPDWPSPDEVTLMRDAAAQREQDVIDAAAGATASTTHDALVLADLEADAAPERLEAFGGLYVAYPSASPSPSAQEDSVGGLQETVIDAQDGHFADALTATDPDLAVLTASAGLSHALSLWYSTWVAGVVEGDEAAASAERVFESSALAGETLVPEGTAVDAATVAELVRSHDEAGYLYEVLAARAADSERDQWLARRDLQRDRASALVALPGIEDVREATYVTPTRELPDAASRVVAAQTEELSIAETYMSLVPGADPEDLAWLLTAAYDAYAQAAAYGDATVQASVPPLPGVASAP
ncbi:DUF4439 domain-containing protein [Demequina globuliformis]|uniref:DUF4439 domain-containing protein n=1 Tax=Demequina globuliformis TaxID=676202 RepID=UPI000A6B8B16|nr:DUF4439 domain-containing protein [Demequina globuliformis]